MTHNAGRRSSITIEVPSGLSGEALETLRSTMQGATASVADIVRRLDEAKADAARWRYIRENFKHVPALDDNGRKWSPVELDNLIDDMRGEVRVELHNKNTREDLNQ